jgi:signal transduction histidine kinase/FixJ family two-component response regulator
MQDATYSLIVLDDDVSIRGAICHWARSQGYQIFPAGTAQEARKIVAENQVDLALVDIRLPDGDGIDLAESLIEEDPERPIILMTAYADLETARSAIRVGVFEFFAKPLSFELLKAAVSRALQHRSRLIENRMNRTAELAEINRDLKLEIRQRREGEQVLAEHTRALSVANERLQQKDRLLTAYQGIARIALSSLNMDEIIDSVGRQLIEARIFKNLAIAVVDEDSRSIEVVRHVQNPTEGKGGSLIAQLLGADASYSLDEPSVVAMVVRTGGMKVVDSAEGLPGQTSRALDGDLAYFVPIKTEDRVIGVLGIGCLESERGEMLRHIEAMEPMLDQVAFALDHALLYRASQDYGRVISNVNASLEKEMDERRRVEEAVVRLERLSALGEMSAGISHNLNNILTGILGPAELISLMTKEEDVLKEADLIRTSALRARDLVMRLHESVRVEQEKVGPIDLDAAVEGAIQAASPRWKDEPESRGLQVEVFRDLHSGATVAATGPGLRDLVMNLLFNASDALTTGGKIRVSTRTTEGRGYLRVSDDGIGMR